MMSRRLSGLCTFLRIFCRSGGVSSSRRRRQNHRRRRSSCSSGDSSGSSSSSRSRSRERSREEYFAAAPFRDVVLLGIWDSGLAFSACLGRVGVKR